ncbi:MAG: hypothetical protein JSS28_07140, partial [Proteobacteria bacterium]|nr:hypothetical protein [Pseudomonadota bacterium]
DMAFAGAHLNNGFNGATGAVEIVGSGNGSVGIAASAIYNNKTDTSAPLRGAGLYALMSGHSQVYLTFTNIFGNHITGSTGTGDAQGAGAMFSLSDSAGASIDSSRISENTIDYPTGGCQGAGLYVATTAYASFFLDRSTVTHNSLGNCLRRNAAGGYFYADNTSNQAGYTLIDHARWIGNLTGASSGVDQVVLDAHNASLQYMSNNLVVGGDARGLWTNAVDGSTVIVLNDTIANNTSYGLEVAGNTQVYNSISWSNGANLLQGAGSTLSHCLTAADPLFVSVAANNYRLRSGSPAIDAGTNTLSTGQILQGGVDLDGLARIQGAAIDIGAYETGDDIFRDDFDAANY